MWDTVFESPFREHFNTNYVPTDAEIDLIRAHLAPHEAELGRLESLIHDLTVQRDRVKAHMDSHRDLISQSRRLPRDVIEQIFLACLPTQHNAVMSVAEAPLLLGHICSAWRSIVFAMPRLWESLHISVDFISDGGLSRRTAVVEWLTRSAPHPLSISVSCNDWNYYDGDITNLLIPFSERWHALRISNLLTEDLSLMVAVDAPLLANIHIICQNSFDKGSQVLESNLFRGMNTQRVTITCRDLASLVPTTLFGWDHLTDLTLGRIEETYWGTGLDCGAARRLLKGCTRLRSLEFPLQLSQEQATEPLTLPFLESLIIVNYCTSFEAFTNVVDQLVMPRLNKFHLTTQDFGMASLISTITFLEHLGDRSLMISDLNLDGLNFLGIGCLARSLPRFPCLERLCLSLWTPATPWISELNAEELLSILIPVETSNSFPVLKDLVLETEEFADDIWMNFLRMHLNRRTALRSFHLHFSCYSAPEIPDVRPFLARGLDVSLDYTPLEQIEKPTPWLGIER
ncbi:hypothetical protein K438DRAFT_1846313 [Mycena galopus ATCC 62051]|nr:hypothetical protein K438DRAFT_1846313 [Mycena galopus ATCC 62051]